MTPMVWLTDKDQQTRMQADQGLPRLLQLPREPQGRAPQDLDVFKPNFEDNVKAEFSISTPASTSSV